MRDTKSTLGLRRKRVFFSDYKSSFLVILVLLVILIFVLILLVVLILFVLIILVLVVILVLVLILVIHKKSPRFQPLLSVKQGEIYYIPNKFFVFSRAAVNICAVSVFLISAIFCAVR